MASIVRIKRSEVSGNPATLGQGELAYSALPDNGSNGGDRLYVGMGTETAGNAVNHVVIGGKYFTSMIDAATNANTASTLVKRDASGNFSAGTITATLSGNASTATKWATARNLTLTGDATATIASVDGSANATGALTLATVNASVGTFGGSTAIPVITVNAKGLITGVSTSSISSSFTLGTTVISLGGTQTSLAGLTEVTVDNINLNGNTISSTDANGDLILSPNGTGNVDVTNSRIIGVSTPVNDNDAANKLYVDTVAAEGLHVKEGVDAATTNTLAVLSGGTITYNNGTAGVGATLTTTGSYAIGNPIDGVNLVGIGYGVARVLVKNETNAAHNGIYILTSATVMTRDSAFDSDAEIEGGDFVFVVEGTANAGTGWVQTATVNIVGTDNIVWQQFSGAGTYTADGGLTLVGNTFAVGQGLGITVNANDVALASTVAGNGLTYTTGVLNVVGTANRITANADSIDIASTYVGQTSITTLGTIATGTWNATAIGATKGGTGLTTYATGDIIYASAANTLAKRAIGVEGQFLQVNASGVPVWADIDGGTY